MVLFAVVIGLICLYILFIRNFPRAITQFFAVFQKHNLTFITCIQSTRRKHLLAFSDFSLYFYLQFTKSFVYFLICFFLLSFALQLYLCMLLLVHREGIVSQCGTILLDYESSFQHLLHRIKSIDNFCALLRSNLQLHGIFLDLFNPCFKCLEVGTMLSHVVVTFEHLLYFLNGLLI